MSYENTAEEFFPTTPPTKREDLRRILAVCTCWTDQLPRAAEIWRSRRHLAWKVATTIEGGELTWDGYEIYAYQELRRLVLTPHLEKGRTLEELTPTISE